MVRQNPLAHWSSGLLELVNPAGWMIPTHEWRAMMRADGEAQQLSDPQPQAGGVYDAFISYDHDDRAVAQGIQRGLHRIGKRIGQLRALRVFRDSTDLSASPNLWGKVTDA